MHDLDGQINRVVTRVYEAERHAGSLQGPELELAGRTVAALAARSGCRVLAADPSGDRIIGAASVAGEISVADTSRRFDGMSILLVAGMIAGPHGIERAALMARSIGALEVHCIHLGGWDGGIGACDSTHVVQAAGADLTPISCESDSAEARRIRFSASYAGSTLYATRHV